MVDKRIGLNTYDVSTDGGPIKAAHGSHLKHPLTDLIGAPVDLSYTHEKLSVKDEAQDDDYLVNRILWHRLKPG